ncbi:hypothetical protein HMPREF0620_0218 [Parascardovia denticolens DSM 10105 = JCM 12538]|uniref:Uncharacterized protein n=1 Tax=Parascardovia denticolens DSM 10105 = JCM 12538 TaxID=864564 RepID=E6JZR7_PARDN|nr:hypothetical protein HMPREF0620_0218 [Parascardovia denticolens DSM 10105 = JCM 12538]BAR05884.1 hypothetical protein PSDT_1365 [Parascardovia denticolens DSM 10105 = JCM 12538]
METTAWDEIVDIPRETVKAAYGGMKYEHGNDEGGRVRLAIRLQRLCAVN